MLRDGSKAVQLISTTLPGPRRNASLRTAFRLHTAFSIQYAPCGLGTERHKAKGVAKASLLHVGYQPTITNARHKVIPPAGSLAARRQLHAILLDPEMQGS